MSLEKILERIRIQSEQKSAEIVRQAEEEACTLLAQAQLKANAVYEEAFREAQRPAEGECARLLNEARFEADCVLGQTREHFIDTVIHRLRERLACIRESANYAQILGRQLREVLPPENGSVPAREQMILETDPRDCELMAELLLKAGLPFEIRGTLECMGGVNATSPGRGSTVVNTLDSRLERALPYLRRELARQFLEHTSLASEAVAGTAGKTKPN